MQFYYRSIQYCRIRILLCRAIEHIDTSEKLFVDLSFCNLPLVIRRKQYTYSDEIKDFMHGIRFNIVVVVIRVYFVLYQVHKFILFIHIILLLQQTNITLAIMLFNFIDIVYRVDLFPVKCFEVLLFRFVWTLQECVT